MALFVADHRQSHPEVDTAKQRPAGKATSQPQRTQDGVEAEMKLVQGLLVTGCAGVGGGDESGE